MSPRNEAIAERLMDLLHDAPTTHPAPDVMVRRMDHGALTFVRTDMPGTLLLDVWLADAGKIAAFRAEPANGPFRTVSFSAKLAPRLLVRLGLTQFLPKAEVIPFPAREARP